MVHTQYSTMIVECTGWGTRSKVRHKGPIKIQKNKESIRSPRSQSDKEHGFFLLTQSSFPQALLILINILFCLSVILPVPLPCSVPRSLSCLVFGLFFVFEFVLCGLVEIQSLSLNIVLSVLEEVN